MPLFFYIYLNISKRIMVIFISRIENLKEKEVINIRDGVRLGYVSDIEINVQTGRVINIIVSCVCKLFGIFGKESEYIIRWCEIIKIGDDIILVDINTNEALIEL